MNLYIKTYRFFHGVHKNEVFFMSFGGTYSDNPRAISEALHAIRPNTKIFWAINDFANTECFPDYVHLVKTNNIKQFNIISTSTVWVFNFYSKYHKSKKQFYVQTWHGDRGFKKVLHDSGYMKKNATLLEEKNDYCNLAVAGSAFGEQQFRSAFRYKGEVLNLGTPRNDRLVNFNLDEINFIKKKLGITDEKILLYAPTLRKNSTHTLQKAQNISIEETLSELELKYNCNWICLIRCHPGVVGLSDIQYTKKIINVSNYQDMAELLLVSDMLITDYSSSAGDFALLNRPIILYQSDIQEYQKRDRTFCFSMKDSPYYIAKTQDELMKIIENLSAEKIKSNCEEILKFYNTYESGQASLAVAKRIAQWLDNRDKNL